MQTDPDAFTPRAETRRRRDAGRLTKGLALGLALAIWAAQPVVAQSPDPVRGRALAERWCVSCHVVGPEGPGADAGPAFATLGDRSDARLRGWIASPHPPMPDMQISGRDIDDLVAHIRAVASQ